MQHEFDFLSHVSSSTPLNLISCLDRMCYYHVMFIEVDVIRFNNDEKKIQ